MRNYIFCLFLQVAHQKIMLYIVRFDKFMSYLFTKKKKIKNYLEGLSLYCPLHFVSDPFQNNLRKVIQFSQVFTWWLTRKGEIFIIGKIAMQVTVSYGN